MTNVDYLYNNETETKEKLMMKRRDDKSIVEIQLEDNHVGDASFTKRFIAKSRLAVKSKIFKTKYFQIERNQCEVINK